MRTNNKIMLLFLVTVIVLGIFLTSACEKDNGVEPEKNESIVGAWRLVTAILKDTPVGNITLPAAQFLGMSETGAATSTMQFNEDGSASLTTTFAEGSDEVVPGTWSQDGDNVTIDGAGIDATVPYNVDGTTLTLTLTMPIDFDSDGTADDTKVDMVYNKL